MVKVKTKSARKSVQKTTSCKEPTQCPHEHYRYDVPDRRGIARDKHTNILATPKGYRWEDVTKESGDGEKPARKTATTSRRMCPDKYLKKPEKAYLHNFLAEVWSFLTPEMADRLKNMLMNEFSMSSKDAEEFIFKQREANIVNSSTVSLYKKPRDIGDGKVVLDSVIKMRTPNKTYCDKFPKSNIGIRNSWIKDFSDLISNKMADYVLDTMTAERTERQQEIASNLLNRFNTLLEQKASLANPKTQTHKTMVLVADRLSIWLDKNVPMSKDNAQRLKDVEEALERKKLEDERRKQIKDEQKLTEQRAEEEGFEDEERQLGEGEGDQGPRGPPPGAPGTQPGEPVAQPEETGAQPSPPETVPGASEDVGVKPASGEEPPVTAEGTQLEDGTKPSSPEKEPVGRGEDDGKADVSQPGQTDDTEPGKEEAEAQPEEAGPRPAEPETQPGAPETKPDEPGTQPDGPGSQSTQPETATGAPEEDGIKPAAGQEPPTEADGTQLEDGTKPPSPKKELTKGEEEGGTVDVVQPEQADGTLPGKADETQPGSAQQTNELKEKEDKDQEPPLPAAEEATPVESEQPTGKEEKEPQPDVPPPSDIPPVSADTSQPEKFDETQPGASDQGKPQEEPKGDEEKYEEPTSEAYEPPPPGDDIQLTPSEIQEKADAEARAAEKADAGAQDTSLPGDADQKIISGEETPTDVPSETQGSAPEKIGVSDELDKMAPTGPGEGEETTPGAGDEKVSEPGVPVSEDGAPADQKVSEAGIGEKGESSTRPGEEPITRPGEGMDGEARELTPEQKRQQELIQSVAEKILETPVEETPRQEAIKDVLEKQLEKELGDDRKAAIDQVASKVGTWIDKMVDQVETEYGDRGRRVPSGVPSERGRGMTPVSQKPKGSIFVVKKVDDRRGYDVDLISNTRALEKIRLARGKSPARAEVPNPDAALEPADLKNWARWASAVTDMAQSWAEWIEDTIQEVQKRGEILQTDDSPERLREWDEFRGEKSQGAQHWRKTKKEIEQTASLWTQKGMKTQELRKPPLQPE